MVSLFKRFKQFILVLFLDALKSNKNLNDSHVSRYWPQIRSSVHSLGRAAKVEYLKDKKNQKKSSESIEGEEKEEVEEEEKEKEDEQEEDEEEEDEDEEVAEKHKKNKK